MSNLLRNALVRTLVFFALVAVPTIVFDFVYWSQPLPWSLLTPSEVALRLTFTFFVTTLVEHRWERWWTPGAVFLTAAVCYAIGYVEGEYLNGVLHGRTPEAGLQALLEHGRLLAKRPRHFAILYGIVSTPFAVASFTRLRRFELPLASFVSCFVTLVVAFAFIEEFRVGQGRILAAFICVRTTFCGLMLPAVAHAALRLERPPMHEAVGGTMGGSVGAAPHE